MTTIQGRTFGLNALFILIALIIFALGTAGVHYQSVTGARWTDLGLVFIALGM